MLRYCLLRLGLVAAALAALVAASGCQANNDAVVRSRSSTSASSDSYNPTSADRLRGSRSDQPEPGANEPDDAADDVGDL